MSDRQVRLQGQCPAGLDLCTHEPVHPRLAHGRATSGDGLHPGLRHVEADGFELCGETETTCSFNATKDQVISCDDVCQQHGGGCIAAMGNGTDKCTDDGVAVSCAATNHTDDICVCTLGPPPPSCEQQYGAVPGFVPCAETPTTCSFSATKDQVMSCDDVCQDHGGTCIDAMGNGGDKCVEGAAAVTCATADHTDDICVCTRG